VYIQQQNRKISFQTIIELYKMTTSHLQDNISFFSLYSCDSKYLHVVSLSQILTS
jgi:hypothetical protein